MFLEFLKGNYQLDCSPWGNPTYNVFGWQKPCYLLDEGHCDTFQQLMESTDWNAYGHQSGNPSCRDCLVHSGFEPSAVKATFGSLRGLLMTARLSLLGTRDRGDLGEVKEWPTAAPSTAAGQSKAEDKVQLPILS